MDACYIAYRIRMQTTEIHVFLKKTLCIRIRIPCVLAGECKAMVLYCVLSNKNTATQIYEGKNRPTSWFRLHTLAAPLSLANQ